MDSLVPTERLAAELDDPELVVLDASMHLADTGRDPRAEYRAAHIPGARFMDLAALVDPASPIENTLPSADAFAARVEALGVGNRSRVVIYDDSAIRTSARAWFMFWMFGATNVAILDGGLAKWRTEGRPLTALAPAPGESRFEARRDGALLRGKHDLIANIERGEAEVVDARSAARFAGSAPEPRPGIAPGHIPGAKNVPYAVLFDADGTFREAAQLRAAFADAGVDLDRPVIATCGSGITACVLAFALDRVGKHDVALYDGSWAEWGADPATPKATGSA